MASYRIVLSQQLCVLCGDELYVRDTIQDLLGHLGHACVQLIREQMFRELESHPMTIRIP